MVNTRTFYQNLNSFNDFSQLVDDNHFIRIPDNWHVVISDVRGSTQAIKEGRYKDVNLIGAATIACVANALGSNEMPFVFGGDGATLVVADCDLAVVLEQLKGVQALAKKAFAIDLRVGSVAVGLLTQEKTEIWLGKYQLSPGNCTAQFKGGGLTLAENMIKTGNPSGARLETISSAHFNPQLEGLSCRLDPLPTRNGVILSLLIKPLGAGNKVLGNLLNDLRSILNGDFLSASPVTMDRLQWRWPPQSMGSEVQLQKGDRHRAAQWILTALRTFVSMCSLRFNIPLGPFKPSNYKAELITNSDFKKFDETLRMVIDCTKEQESAIENLLQQQFTAGEIVFGLHRSTRAFMTCVVRNASGNQHIHFIDGGDGGYALAAVQMKSQITALKAHRTPG